MPDAANARVRFLGGAVAREDLFGVLAFPVGLDGTDMEFTRFYTRHKENWFQQEYQSDIASVCYFHIGDDRGWWLLGKRGDVHSITVAGRKTESIDQAGTGPGKLGYAKKIRVINDLMYACGYRRQVYRRVGGQWVSMADAIHASKSNVGVGFNDIVGNPRGELFAVGNRGEIWWFDTQTWHSVDSGTNAHLEAVAVLDDQVIVAGRDGVILRGGHQGFESIGPTTAGLNFWDIAVFEKRIFVSASAGVFKLDAGSNQAFETAPMPMHVGYRLAVGGGRLISLGTHQIFAYDGKTSEELVCPDNT